jgi:DNA ligase-1
MIQQFIDRQSEEDKEFYSQMVTKKYRLGADAKLVNKCIPGLIPTFDVMLGTSIEKVKLKGDERIFISQKLNGTRCAFVGDKCMTRQGKEYIGLQHIIEDLQELVGTNMFVDGELVYKNKEGLSDSEAFQKGTGIAMSKDEDKSDLKLIVFDMFPLDEFWNGQSKETYSERLFNYLLPLRNKVTSNHFENVSVVPMFYNGHDHAEIWNWLDYAENNDMEGVIINLDTPYECKRSKNLIKVKKFYTYDLEVVGVEEGDGRNKGTLGALVVKYKNNTVNVGSGFTDEERKNFWENREDIIGRVIEVKYKEITTDKKTGLESLQFPVFCGLREIGKEPSYN